MEENKNNPLVSIIIPTYNRDNRIIETLESVCDQDYNNIEVIIVDDGSNDNTCEHVMEYINNSSFTRIRLLRQENNGAPSARNNGFRNSNGKYVVFFDSDDIMLKNRISTQVKHMMSTDSEMCACGFFYDNTNGGSYIPPDDNGNLLLKNIRRELLGSTQSWMFSRLLIRNIIGYDEALKCKQDLDLVFRALLTKPKVCIVKEALSIFIRHNGQERIMISTNNLSGLESIFRYNFKVINYCVKNQSYELYKYSIKLLAQDISTICSFKDVFSNRFRESLKKYLDSRIFQTKMFLYYYVSYKLFISPDMRQLLKKRILGVK